MLAWRASSIIKQAITSPPPFFQFVSPGEYAAAAISCLDAKTRDMVFEKSAHMKTRVMDPAMEMIRQMEALTLAGTRGKLEAGLVKIEKTGMKGLEWIDMCCVLPGWVAAYEKKKAELTRKNEGMTDAAIDLEAVRFADLVVRDTQPSSRTVDLTPMFLENRTGLGAIMLQFQVPIAVIFQNLAVDAPNNIRQGKILNAMITYGIYPMIAVALGLMQEPEDEDKFNLKYRGIDALGGLIESIPVFGGGISYAVEQFLREGKARGYKSSLFPLGDSAMGVANAVSAKKWADATWGVAEMFAYGTGLPVGLEQEIRRAVKDEGDFRALLRILTGWR
jgi:hypothetical protein